MQFEKLMEIAARLREPDGCPWDKAQTIESMLEPLENEFNEVKELIVQQNHKNLREELGDLLFQIVGIIQIAKEEGLFTEEEVIKDIYDKVVRRHTWVFGNDKAETVDEALRLWEINKSKEKNVDSQ